MLLAWSVRGRSALCTFCKSEDAAAAILTESVTSWMAVAILFVLVPLLVCTSFGEECVAVGLHSLLVLLLLLIRVRLSFALTVDTKLVNTFDKL